MRSFLLSVSLFTLQITFSQAQVPDFEWVTGPQGPGSTDFSAMADITADTFGNVIISANFKGTISFGSTTLNSTGPTENNICMVKYNDAGVVLWARRIGDGIGYAGDITSDNTGNIYFVGSFGESVNLGSLTVAPGFCLVKLDPSGNVVWAKQTTGEGSAGGKSIGTDLSGNIYVGGEFGGTPSFEDISLTAEGGTFIAKYDPSGNVQWVKQCTGSGYTGGAYGLGVDKNGNSVITGWFDGTLVWGSTTMTCTFNEMFAVSYNTQGEILWVKHVGQGNLAGGYAAAYDGSGNCYLTGDFEATAIFDDTTVHAVGSWDSFIAKYSPSGDLLFVRTVGGSDAEHGWGIDVDPYDNVVFTGCFANSATFGSTTLTSRSIDRYDIYISKFDESGNFIWAKRAGSDESDQGRGVVINNKGRIFNTGWIQGTSDFDSQEFSPTGTYGIFLSLLEANYITVSPPVQEVDYVSGNVTFSVDANVQWNVSESSTWLDINENGNNIEVYYNTNPNPAERTAQIIVYGDGCKDTVSIKQDAAPCRLVADPDTLLVNAHSGLLNILVESNSEWNFSEVPSWLTASKTHSDTLSVEYSVNEGSERSASITLFNTCLESMEIHITQNGTTGILQKYTEDIQFSIFPNPTNDKIYLESRNEITSRLTVSIYNDIGIKKFSQEFENLDKVHPIEIDMGALPSGIYFLQITTVEATGTIAVIKE